MRIGTRIPLGEFMRENRLLITFRSPFDAAMTDLGARRAESILNALEYGLAV